MSSVAATLPARAELLVGDFGNGDTSVAHMILRFGDTADGNVSPYSAFTTTTSGNYLQMPVHITWEPIENVFYVADFQGQAIRVYSQNAQGDMQPLRVLNPPSLGQPHQVAVSTEFDELYTRVSGCCIGTYARSASGNAALRSRYIQWGGLPGSVTRLNNPSGPVLRKVADMLTVTDYRQNADSSYSGLILSFNRTANGNVAPAAVIEGSLTKLGAAALAPAYDAVHDELIVGANDNVSGTFRVLVFPANAAGNVAPTRAIEGAATLLNAISDIAYDASNETIYVSEGGYNANAALVLAFPRTANGNVAPSRVIAGTRTLFTQPAGLGIGPERLFANGFE